MLKYSRPNILDKVLASGKHAVIEAAAGTGKTYTIENLLVEIILNTDTPIEKILVVTFTEKATGELIGRVRKILEKIQRGDGVDTTANDCTEVTLSALQQTRLARALFGFDGAQIFTIHGFCQRVLGETAFFNGQLFQQEVVRGREIFMRAFRTVLRRDLARHAGYASLLSRYLDENEGDVEHLGRLLYEAHSKNARLVVGDVPSLETEVVHKFLSPVRNEVDAIKRREGALDFDDMLRRLHERLQPPDGDALAALLRSRYPFALIDEFQDTDGVQWGIFRTLFLNGDIPNRLFVIGDPKQAIYGFRGADVQTYLRATAELSRGAAPVPLEKNFRSTKDVIDAYNYLFEGMAPYFTGEIRYDHPVGCGRPEFTIASPPDEPPVTVFELTPEVKKNGAPQVFPGLANLIAREIRDLLDSRKITLAPENKEVTAKDIFILTRTSREQEPIAAALRELGIPFSFFKKEGLFNTPEAEDVKALLAAIDEPGRLSNRLRAWATPFFAIRWRDLRNCRDLPESHPLLRSLERWHELSEARDFGALFEAILSDSHVLERELLYKDSERELTNYLQIFEFLTEEAARRRCHLGELIRILTLRMTTRPATEEEAGDIMRVDTERPAVQIMTIHKSKGLEAGVVFLAGGFTALGKKAGTVVFHRNTGNGSKERCLVIGKRDDLSEEDRDALETENDQEDRRLLYVALTRAKAKLYLPYIATGTVDGSYRVINERLAKIVAGEKAGHRIRGFKVLAVGSGEAGAQALPTVLKQSTGRPSSPLPGGAVIPVDLRGVPEVPPINPETFRHLRFGAHAPLTVMSYTRLKRKSTHHAPIDRDEEAADVTEAKEERRDPSRLPPGRDSGIFLHAFLEQVDRSTLTGETGPAAWGEIPTVRRLLDDLMAVHRIPRTAGPHALRLAHAALTTRYAAGATTLPPLHTLAQYKPELEFVFPIPESAVLGSLPAECEVKRGFVKGFIDIVFAVDGKFYFADWKSDYLEDYGAAALAEHVEREYSLQTQLYSLAIARILGGTEQAWNAIFGGMLYIFVRGLEEGGGVFFAKPEWTSLLSYEAALTSRKLTGGAA